VINSPIEDYSGSNACAQGGVKNISETNACAPNRFSKRRGIAIVVYSCGNSKHALYFGSEREIPPAGNIRRIQDDSTHRIQRTWRANSNPRQTGLCLWARRENGFDSVLHRCESRLSAVPCRHRHSRLKKDVATLVNQACGNFCPTYIHTKRQVAFGFQGWSPCVTAATSNSLGAQFMLDVSEIIAITARKKRS
jgi:hypothetical protein